MILFIALLISFELFWIVPAILLERKRFIDLSFNIGLPAWFVVIAQCPVAALCAVWREFPPQSSSTLVWFGALPARETRFLLPPIYRILLRLGQSGRLGTPFIHFFSLTTWLRLCRLSSGVGLVCLAGLYMTWFKLFRVIPCVITSPVCT